MSNKGGKKRRREKEKKAKRTRSEQKVKRDNTLPALTSITHPHLHDIARCLGEAVFLFPEMTRQYASYTFRNDKQSELMTAIKEFENKTNKYDLHNSSKIYQPLHPLDPHVYMREIMNGSTSATFEESSEEHLIISEWAILGNLTGIKIEEIKASKSAMEEDAKKSLANLRKLSSNSTNSNENNDLIMNLAIRYIQSLLASRLGFTLNYAAPMFDNHVQVLTKECFEASENPFLDLSHAFLPERGYLCNEAASYIYERDLVRHLVVHHAACMIVTKGLVNHSPCATFSWEADYLFERAERSSLFAVSGLWSSTPDMAEAFQKQDRKKGKMFLFGDVEMRKMLHNVYCHALEVPLFHALNLITVEDILAVEPFISERRTEDWVLPFYYQLHCGVHLLNNLYDMNMPSLRINAIIELCNIIWEAIPYPKEAAIPHKEVLHLNFLQHWLGTVGRLDAVLGESFEGRTEAVINPKTAIEGLESYILWQLKELTFFDWSKSKDISERVSNLIGNINKDNREKFSAGIDSFVQSIKTDGLTINSFGKEITCHAKDYLQKIGIVEADGKPILALTPMPDWIESLHSDSKKAVLSAEKSFCDYTDFIPTPRIKTCPEDWSPVLVSFATALENEFARKPYEFAINAISKDTSNWPTEELKELSNKQAYVTLTKDILKIRDGKKRKLPTLGNICFYLEEGRKQIKTIEDLNKHNLFVDFFTSLHRSKKYQGLLSTGFIKSLISFKEYRNEVAHPPPVDKISATVCRRLAMSMLELLTECYLDKNFHPWDNPESPFGIPGIQTKVDV